MSERVARVPRSDHGEGPSTGVTSAVVTRAGGAVVPTEGMGEGMGEASPEADTTSTNATNNNTRPRRLGNSRNCPLIPLTDTRRTRVCISYLRHHHNHLPALGLTTLGATRYTNIHPSRLPLRCTHLSLNRFRNFHSRSIPPDTIYLGSWNIT